jgi:hypothetical protein
VQQTIVDRSSPLKTSSMIVHGSGSMGGSAKFGNALGFVRGDTAAVASAASPLSRSTSSDRMPSSN